MSYRLTKYQRASIDMEHGYKLVKNFADSDLVTSLEQVLLRHHNLWIEQNKDFYQEKAINSAYITRKNNLSDEDRMILFSFIAWLFKL